MFHLEEHIEKIIYKNMNIQKENIYVAFIYLFLLTSVNIAKRRYFIYFPINNFVMKQ